ncbi:hypothetical protein [Crossiella sp. CA198]|uniref:hypothetical protein n=1 Tax=Crossiella sp. CA198 TaxID=3455607 RepID=UPI003F8D380F
MKPAAFSAARIRTQLRRLLVVAGILAACSLVPGAGVAGASGLTLVLCPLGTETSTYTPGLNNTVREITYSGSDTATCLSLGNPLINSFVAPFSGQFEGSCELSFDQDSGTQTFDWNVGASSVWNYTSVVSTNPQGQVVVVLEGPIVAGQFTGATARQVVVLPELDLTACATETGITGRNGVFSLVITS